MSLNGKLIAKDLIQLVKINHKWLFVIHGHMRTVLTIFQICLKNFGPIYMKLTYFLFVVNNYILPLHWGNFGFNNLF